MAAKICITFGVLIYALVVPLLEVNASHVFNESWPAHARFHEVWQLVTNVSIGMVVLWLCWFKKEIRLASILNIAVMGGILVAHILESSYGGSIISGNLSKTLLGLELAAFAALLAVVLAVVALILDKHLNRAV
jgi:hypothetical protein